MCWISFSYPRTLLDTWNILLYHKISIHISAHVRSREICTLHWPRSDQEWLPTDKRQKPEAPPESPTTAKALDFDDEAAETPSSLQKSSSTEKPNPGAGEDVPPPKPPRPLAPEQQAENTLKEAFPSIDAAVVKAVLRASGGRVEPAFNALLGI